RYNLHARANLVTHRANEPLWRRKRGPGRQKLGRAFGLRIASLVGESPRMSVKGSWTMSESMSGCNAGRGARPSEKQDQRNNQHEKEPEGAERLVERKHRSLPFEASERRGKGFLARGVGIGAPGLKCALHLSQSFQDFGPVWVHVRAEDVGVGLHTAVNQCRCAGNAHAAADIPHQVED